MERSYRRSPDMVARKIADEVILVPIRNNAGDLQCIYTLDEVAAFVWDHIGDGQTVSELAKAVCSEFEVEPARVQADLQEFLTQMEQVGAVGAV